MRLTAAQGGSSESYTYDPAGNITDATTASGSTSFLVNELNQIESANNTTYTYNADGELVDDGTNTYSWNAAGNLIEITNKQSGHTSQFTYDGFGRRISDTETDPSATPVTTRFLWCGLHLCEKRDSTDAVLARYFPQGELQGGQILFYARDQVGSVTAVVDTSGQLVGRLSYDSYGNITSSSGTLPDFRYAGLFFHQPTGLELATYRAYNPLARRWISRDPLRESGGLNLYAYVQGGPVYRTDPLGLFFVFHRNEHILTWVDPMSGIATKSWPAVSGPYGQGPLPYGWYYMTGEETPAPINSNSMTDTCGTTYKYRLHPQFKTKRNHLLLHPDGGVPGTAGCIGVEECTSSLRNFINSMLDRPRFGMGKVGVDPILRVLVEK